MEMYLAIAPISILAEIPDYAVGDALDILQNHSFISNQLAESFQTVWDGIIFNTNSSFREKQEAKQRMLLLERRLPPLRIILVCKENIKLAIA